MNKEQKVKYYSKSGKAYFTEFNITSEGFIAIIDNGEELLFSKSGVPINTFVDTITGYPKIEVNSIDNLENNSYNGHHKATKKEPWDNMFALKTLSIKEWKRVLDILIENGQENNKIHLKNIGESATIPVEVKNKIRQVFLNSNNNRKRKNKK